MTSVFLLAVLIAGIFLIALLVATLAFFAIAIAVAVVGTLICIGIVHIFTKLRVEPKEELIGLDITQHGESAYPSFNGLD